MGRKRSKSLGDATLSEDADGDNEVTATTPKIPQRRIPVSAKENQLCRRCSAIEWQRWAKFEHVRKRHATGRGSLTHAIWESHAELKESSCHVCQLFAEIKPSVMDNYGGILTPFLATMSFGSDAIKMERSLQDSSLLGIKGPNCDNYIMEPCFLAVVNPKASLYSGTELTGVAHTAIDFAWIRDCLKFCNQNHAGTCLRGTTPAISGFRVIDCSNRSVVSAPENCHYTALSYVWGLSVSTHSNGFSPVVEDSISATLALGFKYLWVDRYVSSTLKCGAQTLLTSMEVY